jgi:hypothetical protein
MGNNKKPQNINPNLIGHQGQAVLNPDVLKKAEDMLCMNEIPKLDKDKKPIAGEFTQCNGEIFVDAYRLKYVSPILSPVGRNTVGNLMVGKLCIVCGKIFNPDEWMKQREAHTKAVKETVLEKGGDKRADP